MSYALLQYKDVITRSDHRCFACLRRFPKGSKMEYSAHVNDGQAYSSWTCPTCKELMRIGKPFFFNEDYNWFDEGCVKEAMHEFKIADPEVFLELIKTGKMKTEQQKVTAFNQKYAVGDEVPVTLDDESVQVCKVKHPATLMGGHTAVGWFDGIRGAYSLDRVPL